MYTREKRIKAVELWLKYNKKESAVIHELGYPSRKMLFRWYNEFQKEKETGIIHDRYYSTNMYTPEEKQTAVDYYLEHGECLSQTVKALGYPCRQMLLKWCRELIPEFCKTKRSVVKFLREQKEEAVISFCCGRKSIGEAAETAGVSRATLYKWKNELLGKEISMAKSKPPSHDLSDDKNQLLSEINLLKEQVLQLKLERDILEAAAELIKKEQGVDLKNLTNREKKTLIDALKSKYRLINLLKSLSMPKSSYYYQRWAAVRENKYEKLKNHIFELFKINNSCYGYRRVHKLLEQEGICTSEKVVRKLMLEAELAPLPRRKRKFNSYQGEITQAPDNLLKRDFHADSPNRKWLTDITEFHIPAGKAYLSPIVDCFDGLLVSWTVSTRPDSEMVNSMLDMAAVSLYADECPIIHSDRGGHYRWPGWIKRIEQTGLIRSMSKKGCPPDNAACEGLFGRIKNEMFYNQSWKGISMDSFINSLDSYLHWYNNKRIKMSLGGMSPVQYRLSLGLSR